VAYVRSEEVTHVCSEKGREGSATRHPPLHLRPRDTRALKRLQVERLQALRALK
jgi:hypothetical protein